MDKAIVFTTTTDDPKLLLTVGDLVDTSSCQNYRTGSHIETLLGYVVDGNVKAVLSYALKAKDFATPADYEGAKALIESGVKPEFIPAKQQLRIGDTVIDLPKAYRRHIVKLGATPSGSAGIFLERAYAQNHPAEGVMQQQVDTVRDRLAKASGAVTDQSITIPQSRNPGGVYSDAFGGVAEGAHSITVEKTKPIAPGGPEGPPPEAPGGAWQALHDLVTSRGVMVEDDKVAGKQVAFKYTVRFGRMVGELVRAVRAQIEAETPPRKIGGRFVTSDDLEQLIRLVAPTKK